MHNKLRNILITPALPYANGPIHIGHLVEHLQVDIWRRFQLMRGHNCVSICADDTHGTAIMLSAKQNNIKAEDLINKTRKEHLEDFKKFEVEFNYYGSTHSNHNKQLAYEIYDKLKSSGKVHTKSSQQLYCQINCKMFLPDRFVVGTCPNCKSKDQYGDQCDKCSSSYETHQLIEPRCKTCGNKPSLKETEHLYFKLGDYASFLREWVQNHTPPSVCNKLLEWIDKGLEDWCISRDAPYFGFEIPDHPNKFFYVWLDAPIGYISSTLEWSKNLSKSSFDLFWHSNDSELYHVIGKDITYFHSLFWPAILKESGFRLPTQIWVHGFLTMNGEKMSKSKGTFIPANIFAKHMNPIYLRYYIASKLNSGIDDFDLSAEDLVAKVNSDLIGKITNIASRGCQMIEKNFGSIVPSIPKEFEAIIESAKSKADLIAEHYENRDYAKLLVEIRQIAEETNRFFDSFEPWKLISSDPDKCKGILTAIIHVFRILAIYLQPVLPSYSEKVAEIFGESTYKWDDIQTTIIGKNLKKYSHLASRIELSQIDKMIVETKSLYSNQNNRGTNMSESIKSAVEETYITIDDFSKIEIKVGKVIEATAVVEADKLINLKVDIGGEIRNIFSGIKAAYDPTTLVGRHVAVITNLKPRKMKFGISEGMILAAGNNENGVFIIAPDQGAKAGDRIT